MFQLVKASGKAFTLLQYQNAALGSDPCPPLPYGELEQSTPQLHATACRALLSFFLIAGLVVLLHNVPLQNQHNPHFITMTRSHKFNERDHAGLRDGTASEEQHLPRYFAKHGHADADPKKVKKEGGGKANWGQPGDEVADGAYNLNNPRRRSNSLVDSGNTFKTKFETVEPEPVFEEAIHGDGGPDKHLTEQGSATDDDDVTGAVMSRYDTSSKSSASEESIEEGARKL